MNIIQNIKSTITPAKPKITVDTIVQEFTKAVEQLEAVRADREKVADDAAELIRTLEAQRVDAIKEAGRAASVAQKIKALVE